MSIRGQTKKHRWLLQEELLGIEDLEVSHVLPQELLDRKTKIQTELLKILGVILAQEIQTQIGC